MKLARRWNRRAASTKAHRNTISRKAFKDQIRRGLLAERLEDRSLMAADFVAHAYWNVQLPNDVTNDGFVAPSDVLAIVNTINAEGPRELGQPQSEGEAGSLLYFDVNNDGFVSSSDVLAVINELNAEGAPGDPQAKIFLNPINAAGTALPSVQNGQDFFLQMAAQDLRPELFNRPDVNQDGDPDQNFRGVFAAYTDVLFENNLVAPAVNEIQSINVPGSGSSTLTYAGFTAANGASVAGGNVNITFDQTSSATRNSSATAIATAINNVLGAGTVTVAASGSSAYRVTFAKFFNSNIPEPTATNGVTVTEFASTNPADASYSFAFTRAVTFNPDFSTGPFAGYAADDTGTFRLDDIGSTFAGNTQVVILDPVEIVRVHMFANLLPQGTPSDTAHFNASFGTTVPANPPDPGNPSPKGIIRPQHDTLVIGNLDANPVEESCLGDDATAVPPACNVPFNNGALITSQPGMILITTGPVSADSFSTSISENAAATTIDLFTLGNVHLNQGASGTIELKSVGTASSGTVTKSGNSAIYTPAPNANNLNLNGPATFTYTVGLTTDTDPTKFTTAQVTVNISAVNNKPVIAGPTGPLSMQENTPLAFTGANVVSLSDVDFGETGTTNVEQIDLTVTQGKLAVTAGAGVSGNNSNHVTISGTLTEINTALAGLTYTAADVPSASDTLHITATDNGNVGSGGAQTALAKDIVINITAQNDPPVNLDNAAPIVNNSHIVVNPTTAFTFSAHGHVFTVADPDSANLTVTVSLGAGQGTLDTGGAASSSLILTGSPTTINAALNNLTYTPPGGSNPATMTISSNDGVAAVVTSTIILDLDPGVRPFAVDDQFPFNEGVSGAQSLDVLGNDFKANGATTTIVAVGTPVNNNGNGSFPAGSVVIHADGLSLDYTPPADANFFTPSTPITFTYTIHDDVAGSTDRTATVSVTIRNIPDPPDAVDDPSYGASFANGVGTPLNVNAANGVLKNDTDVDNNYGNTSYATLSVITTPVTPPTKGTLTLNQDGSFIYTPTSFNPAQPNDTFTYRVHAVTPENAPGGIDGDTATVTIHVTAPPVATNDHFNVLEQGNPATAGNVITGNGSNPASQPDTDGEGQNLTIDAASFVQISDPTKGSVTLNPDGSFTYNPPTGQNFNTTRPQAPDVTFSYKVRATDGRLSNAATVSLTVQEVNDPPTAVIDDGPDHTGITVVKKNAAGTIGVNQPIVVLGNDSVDPDSPNASATSPGTESLTIVGISATNGGFGTSEVTTAAGGKVRLVGGQIVYDSPLNTGADSFFYQISDNSAAARGGPLFASAEVKLKIVDFVPKTVSGTIFVDSNRDGALSGGEKVLSGVTVHLTGTDFTDQPVSLTTTTDASGHYQFPASGIGLAPPKTGTSYTVSEDQPLFLLNGTDIDGSTNIDTTLGLPVQRDLVVGNNQFLLVWSVTDTSGDVTNLNFAEAGIDVRTQSQGGSLLDASGIKQEYLASSGQNGFIFELDLNDNMGWSWLLDPTGTAWAGTSHISASLSADLSLLEFTVDGVSVTLTQNYSIAGSTARFRILGIGPNGQYIIRVDGSSDGSSLTTQPYDGMFAANGAGGEGEAPQVNRDYAGAADAVFADQAWA